jgi:hypothetical protein
VDNSEADAKQRRSREFRVQKFIETIQMFTEKIQKFTEAKSTAKNPEPEQTQRRPKRCSSDEQPKTGPSRSAAQTNAATNDDDEQNAVEAAAAKRGADGSDQQSEESAATAGEHQSCQADYQCCRGEYQLPGGSVGTSDRATPGEGDTREGQPPHDPRTPAPRRDGTLAGPGRGLREAAADSRSSRGEDEAQRKTKKR